MAAILVYSEDSVPCQRILQYIQENPVLVPLIQLYDVNQHGTPNTVRITSIPAIVTQEKQVIEGRAAVQVWLESFTTPVIQKYVPGSSLGPVKSLSGNAKSPYFTLDQRGRNLQPAMTESLQRKINMSIDEGLKARMAR